MRCPGRGRKHGLRFFFRFSFLFGNEMPRKGTETVQSAHTEARTLFGNEMPRKGTETNRRHIYKTHDSIWKWDAPEGDGNRCSWSVPVLRFVFGNEMPRKGTETGKPDGLGKPVFNLEMRCPGRGRKRQWHLISSLHFKIWKWDAPEGDGNYLCWHSKSPGLFIWKWDAPEGDGNFKLCIFRFPLIIWKWDAPEGDGNCITFMCSSSLFYLEMRCPGRGRKPGSWLRATWS